jgi:hypothetical protein
MAQRGRPKVEELPPKSVFNKVYTNDDGSKETWHYDLNKFPNGPLKVEISYPTKYESFEDKNAKLPPTKRKYLNPSTNKYVGYGRAKQLGLI